MNELQVFNHPEFGEVRTVDIDGEPWLVGKDVAVALGYANPNESIREHVDNEDKLKSDSLSSFSLDLGQRGGWLINESGLYSLVLSSKLPGAKKFRRWVTSEVLPSIRKGGGYICGQESMTPEELMASAFVVAQKVLAERDTRLAAMSAQMEIVGPKAEYFDELVERNTLTNFRETAKELGVKERRFVQFLTDQSYIFRDKRGRLLPCAAKNDGLFEVKECFNNATKWSGTQTLITPRGRETFRLLCKGIS